MSNKQVVILFPICLAAKEIEMGAKERQNQVGHLNSDKMAKLPGRGKKD